MSQRRPFHHFSTKRTSVEFHCIRKLALLPKAGGFVFASAPSGLHSSEIAAAIIQIFTEAGAGATHGAVELGYAVCHASMPASWHHLTPPNVCERRARVNYLVHAYSLITRLFSIGRIALVQLLCWGATRRRSIRPYYQGDWWQRTAREGTPPASTHVKLVKCRVVVS